MKKGHEPIRECICCGKKFPKAGLIRIVKNNTGIYVDAEKASEGRGAYLCYEPCCLEKLVQQKRLHRAFKQPIEAAVYQEIARHIEGLRKAELREEQRSES
ncbi:MAG: YlxR family protein [Ruminococcaceae bacterium]|nr:YlxR family protein [Oscillospiraceae bacterium]